MIPISIPRKGIGPTYASKMNRTGVRVADLMDNFSDFSNKFSILADNYMASFPGLKVRKTYLPQNYWFEYLMHMFTRTPESLIKTIFLVRSTRPPRLRGTGN